MGFPSKTKTGFFPTFFDFRFCNLYSTGSLPKLDYFGKSKHGYYLVSNFLIPGSNLLRFKLDLGKFLVPYGILAQYHKFFH